MSDAPIRSVAPGNLAVRPSFGDVRWGGGRRIIGWKPNSPDPSVASARIRCLNPLRQLQSEGFPVEIFDPSHADRYAVVVFSKLYDDRSQHEARGLKTRGVRIVLDLCDNHFYNPDGLPALQERADKLRKMMLLADELVASTAAMAAVMQAEMPERRSITVIGDGVEEAIHGLKKAWPIRRLHAFVLDRLLRQIDRTPISRRLVWFGIHGGPHAEHGMLDLLKLRALLERLSSRHSLTLTVISNSRRKYREQILPWRVRTHYLEWQPDTFLSALKAHGVALVPVTTNAFTECKSNNRVVLALASGLAVIADPIPSYEEFSEAVELGDWENGLERYLSDPAAQAADVAIGREIIAERWTIPRVASRWRELFVRLQGA